MKKLIPLTLSFCFILLSLTLIDCTPQQDAGKIPITTNSKEARAHYLQARNLSEKLRGQESIEHYEKAIALDPDFAIAHLNLAFVQPSAKGFFESLDKAKNSKIHASKGEQLWIEGASAGVDGFPIKQRELYLKLVEIFPDDERAHNILAGNYFGQQDYADAIASYTRATEIAPDFSQPYNQLGYAHRFMGNYEEAEKAFKKYIELIPNDPNPYDSYAELLMKMGKFEESIESYRKAISINKNFVASYIGIATNFNLMDRHKEAWKQLTMLQDIARDDGERRTALFGKTVSYVDEGNFEMALKQLQLQYDLAAKINDAAAMSGDVITMGSISLQMGNPTKAMQFYERGLMLILNSDLSEKIKENTERTHIYNVARVYLAKSVFKTAKNMAKDYMEKVRAVNNPTQIKLAHELTGQIALAEKNYEAALAALMLANQQNPYNHYRMALCHEGLGDKDNMIKSLELAANFNALNNINYAFIRNKAKTMLTTVIQ